MKSKRRQELRTNDLAQFLDDLNKWFRDWGVYAVGGAIVVVAIIAIVFYMNSARAEAVDKAYLELRTAAQVDSNPAATEVEQRQAIEKMDELADRTNNETFKLDAIVERGDVALRLAVAGPGPMNREYLQDAGQAYQEVVDHYQKHTLYYGKALYGLFVVEADQFSIDGDESHRAQAVKYLETIRDDPRFRGTPFMTAAVDSLNDIDKIFTRVTFPQQPTPPPTATTNPAAEPLKGPSGFEPSGEQKPGSPRQPTAAPSEVEQEKVPSSQPASD